MQDAWPNPFAERTRQVHRESSVGDISDDDDQVVYHADHLENLFGLYNRSEEAKYRGPPQQEPFKTGMECFKDHLLLAHPSHRETAVWDALEASDSIAQEAFHAPEDDSEKLWRFSTSKHNEEEQFFGDRLTDGPMDDLEDEDIAAVNCHPADAGYGEASDDINVDGAQSKDGWHRVAQVQVDMASIQDGVSGPSRPKSYCMNQPKGISTKKPNFNFRSMRNVANMHRHAELRDNPENLSLAQKLQSLAETNSSSGSKMNVQNKANCAAPCTKVSMCEKLLELVQSDSSHISDTKGRKSLNAKVKSNSFKQCIKLDKIAARGVTSFHAVERGIESGTSKLGAPNESINDQFQKALLAAPPASTEDLSRQGKGQGLVFGFSARLQKVLENEKNDRSYFLKTLQTRDNCQGQFINCMDVKILSKNLEARLSTCLCDILKFPEACGQQAASHMKVVVIFNMQTNAQLELEAGSVVRLYPPWQEVVKEGNVEKTILCTYHCEVLNNHDIE